MREKRPDKYTNTKTRMCTQYINNNVVEIEASSKREHEHSASRTFLECLCRHIKMKIKRRRVIEFSQSCVKMRSMLREQAWFEALPYTDLTNMCCCLQKCCKQRKKIEPANIVADVVIYVVLVGTVAHIKRAYNKEFN